MKWGGENVSLSRKNMVKYGLRPILGPRVQFSDF